MAEGYDIVSAGDGEEALAMAIKERPRLILSDVMMPKISGFDMLDILRSTTETKDVKVIIMTALSSEDQRKRGEQLGADKYLVKSQVGIEDVVRAVHETLGDLPESAQIQCQFHNQLIHMSQSLQHLSQLQPPDSLASEKIEIATEEKTEDIAIENNSEIVNSDPAAIAIPENPDPAVPTVPTTQPEIPQPARNSSEPTLAEIEEELRKKRQQLSVPGRE